jgi:hypothetical protein
MLYNITQEMRAALRGHIMTHGAASMPGVTVEAKTFF